VGGRAAACKGCVILPVALDGGLGRLVGRRGEWERRRDRQRGRRLRGRWSLRANQAVWL